MRSLAFNPSGMCTPYVLCDRQQVVVDMQKLIEEIQGLGWGIVQRSAHWPKSTRPHKDIN